MFITAWRHRRAAKAQAAREQAIADLRSRAVIRAAEELVSSAWIAHLTQRAATDPVALQRLEWEQVVITLASHSRAQEAARDQRRFADVAAQLDELTGSAHRS